MATYIDVYKPKDVAKIFGVSTMTLRRWEESGKLIAKRSSTNRRYYTRDQLDAFLRLTTAESGKKYAYCRVSSAGQRKDLVNQVDFVKHYCSEHNVTLDSVYTDVGSGLNYNRKNWNSLLSEIDNNSVAEVYITEKDRFVRFGFEWFDNFCKNHGCKIIVINSSEDTSPEKEMTNDLMSIIHVFSCRLYGL
jgi:putative resolvase